MPKVTELGNIRPGHVFRACGNFDLYLLEIWEEAAADENHLEEPAGHALLPLPLATGHCTRAPYSPREKKEPFRCFCSFWVPVSSAMSQPRTSIPKGWGPQVQRNKKTKSFYFFAFLLQEVQTLAPAASCLKTLLHHICLNYPCVTPGHNPKDLLSGALRDPDSQHSNSLCLC